LVNLPPRLQANVDRVKDIEEAAIQFAETFKYPIDANGNVLDINALNHLYPDLLPGLIHHFVKAGWRRVEDKRFIKSRRVIGPGLYEDFVAWGPMDGPDEPIYIDKQPEPDLWSVTPTVTEVFEERDDSTH
jgi:hypothetical protein